MCIRDRAQRKADGSATTGATRPHERPATASTIPKPSAEKMQEVKRPATATTSKASAPVKTNVVKERPLSSGASDRKATQPAQPVHRQNVEKVVSQETHQNDTKDRRIKVQQTQTVQKNQQTIEKTRNLVTKKGPVSYTHLLPMPKSVLLKSHITAKKGILISIQRCTMSL